MTGVLGRLRRAKSSTEHDRVVDARRPDRRSGDARPVDARSSTAAVGAPGRLQRRLLGAGTSPARAVDHVRAAGLGRARSATASASRRRGVLGGGRRRVGSGSSARPRSARRSGRSIARGVGPRRRAGVVRGSRRRTPPRAPAARLELSARGASPAFSGSSSVSTTTGDPAARRARSRSATRSPLRPPNSTRVVQRERDDERRAVQRRATGLAGARARSSSSISRARGCAPTR